MSWAYNKKKLVDDFDEEKFFGKEDDNKDKKAEGDQEDEEDELEMYMKQMEAEVQHEKEATKANPAKKNESETMFGADPVDEYLQHMKKSFLKDQKIKSKNKEKASQNGGVASDQQQPQFNKSEGSEGDYNEFVDADGEIDWEAVKKAKKAHKKVETLEPLDLADMKLEQFEKNFYSEHPQITAMPEQELKSYRSLLQIRVKGRNVPKPIVSFGHIGFNEELIDLITRNNFQKPTAIQSQALPCVLSGRDVVGVAKTGSGKTLAYLWPMLIHILDQRELEKNEGPIGLILAPTRELCQQIYVEAKKYSKKFNISVGCLLGGENKHEQWKMLKGGVEILIASPGRLIQMIKKKATNLLRVTYLVIDEADKMFSMGFEQQVRSIIGQTMEERQTLLFTATLKKNIQSLVADFLNDPITINVGDENQANEDIRQNVCIFNTYEEKLMWLERNMIYFLSRGKVLIFVNQIGTCESLCDILLKKLGIQALALHGDKTQYQRTNIINSFKTKQILLIATDVASRGLDVKEIRTVVNFEIPKDTDTYIHRIGRTGRAADKEGEAYTCLLRTDVKFATALVKVFEASGTPVPPELEHVAMDDDKFKIKRMSDKMGVSFAKGKDATKLLNQALKRQRNSNVRAGIGFVESDLKSKAERDLTLKDMIQKNREALQVDSEGAPVQLVTLNQMMQEENLKKQDRYILKPGESTKYNKFVSASSQEHRPHEGVMITYADGRKEKVQQPKVEVQIYRPKNQSTNPPTDGVVKKSRWSFEPPRQ